MKIPAKPVFHEEIIYLLKEKHPPYSHPQIEINFTHSQYFMAGKWSKLEVNIEDH
jgi:hypothetical protein